MNMEAENTKPVKRASTIAREEELYERFLHFQNIKEFGVSKHSFEWIVQKLHQELHFSPSTIVKKLQEIAKAKAETKEVPNE